MIVIIIVMLLMSQAKTKISFGLQNDFNSPSSYIIYPASIAHLEIRRASDSYDNNSIIRQKNISLTNETRQQISC
jgi:hypothetical protein